MAKSPLDRSPTNCPSCVFTVAMACTRFTSTLIVGDCCARTGISTAHKVAELATHGKALIPLSFHPYLTVHKMLFLPDRDDFLEAVDALQRGIERCTAVWSGDDHRHAGLADQHAPQPV